MSEELLYTSAPKGLKQGSRGFCTVVASAGMTPQMATLLESLSGYRHLGAPGDAVNPVIWRHLTATVGGRAVHVLSRVADAGADYSGRTNKLAHHVAVPTGELNAAGPAWTQRQPATHDTVWNGETRVLAVGRSLPAGAATPRPCEAWKRLTGDAGWGGVLAQRLMDGVTAPIPLIYPASDDPLVLLTETIALLPESMRWRATYTTMHTSIPPGVVCAWRFVLDGTAEADTLRKRPDLERIDLTGRLSAPPTGAWVDAARTGIRPAIAPTDSQPAAPSPTTRQQAPALPSSTDATGAYELAPPNSPVRTPPPPRRRGRKKASFEARPPEKSTSLIAVTAIALIGMALTFSLLAWSLWEPISAIARNISQQSSTLLENHSETSNSKTGQAHTGEQTPVAETPVAEAPLEEAPLEEAPLEETPIEETPIEETPVDPSDSGPSKGAGNAESASARPTPLFTTNVVWCPVAEAGEAKEAVAYYDKKLPGFRTPTVYIIAHGAISKKARCVVNENAIEVQRYDAVMENKLQKLFTVTISDTNIAILPQSDILEETPLSLFSIVAVSPSGSKHVILLKKPKALKPLNNIDSSSEVDKYINSIGSTKYFRDDEMPPGGNEFACRFDVNGKTACLSNVSEGLDLENSPLQIVRSRRNGLTVATKGSETEIKNSLTGLVKDRAAWEQSRIAVRSVITANKNSLGDKFGSVVKWFDRPFDDVVQSLTDSSASTPVEVVNVWGALRREGTLKPDVEISSRRIAKRKEDIELLKSVQHGIGLVPTHYEIIYPAVPISPFEDSLGPMDVVYSSTHQYLMAPTSPGSSEGVE